MVPEPSGVSYQRLRDTTVTRSMWKTSYLHNRGQFYKVQIYICQHWNAQCWDQYTSIFPLGIIMPSTSLRMPKASTPHYYKLRQHAGASARQEPHLLLLEKLRPQERNMWLFILSKSIFGDKLYKSVKSRKWKY